MSVNPFRSIKGKEDVIELLSSSSSEDDDGARPPPPTAASAVAASTSEATSEAQLQLILQPLPDSIPSRQPLRLSHGDFQSAGPHIPAVADRPDHPLSSSTTASTTVLPVLPDHSLSSTTVSPDHPLSSSTNLPTRRAPTRVLKGEAGGKNIFCVHLDVEEEDDFEDLTGGDEDYELVDDGLTLPTEVSPTTKTIMEEVKKFASSPHQQIIPPVVLNAVLALERSDVMYISCNVLGSNANIDKEMPKSAPVYQEVLDICTDAALRCLNNDTRKQPFLPLPSFETYNSKALQEQGWQSKKKASDKEYADQEKLQQLIAYETEAILRNFVLMFLDRLVISYSDTPIQVVNCITLCAKIPALKAGVPAVLDQTAASLRIATGMPTLVINNPNRSFCPCLKRCNDPLIWLLQRTAHRIGYMMQELSKGCIGRIILVSCGKASSKCIDLIIEKYDMESSCHVLCANHAKFFSFQSRYYPTNFKGDEQLQRDSVTANWSEVWSMDFFKALLDTQTQAGDDNRNEIERVASVRDEFLRGYHSNPALMFVGEGQMNATEKQNLKKIKSAQATKAAKTRAENKKSGAVIKKKPAAKKPNNTIPKYFAKMNTSNNSNNTTNASSSVLDVVSSTATAAKRSTNSSSGVVAKRPPVVSSTATAAKHPTKRAVVSSLATAAESSSNSTSGMVAKRAATAAKRRGTTEANLDTEASTTSTVAKRTATTEVNAGVVASSTSTAAKRPRTASSGKAGKRQAITSSGSNAASSTHTAAQLDRSKRRATTQSGKAAQPEVVNLDDTDSDASSTAKDTAAAAKRPDTTTAKRQGTTSSGSIMASSTGAATKRPVNSVGDADGVASSAATVKPAKRRATASASSGNLNHLLSSQLKSLLQGEEIVECFDEKNVLKFSNHLVQNRMKTLQHVKTALKDEYSLEEMYEKGGLLPFKMRTFKKKVEEALSRPEAAVAISETTSNTMPRSRDSHEVASTASGIMQRSEAAVTTSKAKPNRGGNKEEFPVKQKERCLELIDDPAFQQSNGNVDYKKLLPVLGLDKPTARRLVNASKSYRHRQQNDDTPEYRQAGNRRQLKYARSKKNRGEQN